MKTRNYSPLDNLLIGLNDALRTVFAPARSAARANPATTHPETELSAKERRHVAGLMRINHAGEVAAQALYQGQALTARDDRVRDTMRHAAQEENDHLAWCEERLKELGEQPSRLNPLWYAGSFAIGAAAGAAGDKWSLGFIVETEKQVVRHLDEHLKELPSADHKSDAILEQMKVDETQHATTAVAAGAADLPDPIKRLMKATSKVMTRTAYWL